MNKTLTLSATLLLALAMSFTPTAAAGGDDAGCELTLPATECTGGTWNYGGEMPAFDASGTLVAVGTFSVTIYEDWTTPDRYSVTLTCMFDIGAEPVCETTYGTSGGPWSGWQVELIASSADGLALPSLVATHS